MWHIMIYSADVWSEYSHPYVVHLFTSEKPSPEEAFRIAEEILSKAFPEWEKEKNMRYVGYEYLPLNLPPEADKSYVAISLIHTGWRKFDIANIVSTVPQSLASAIEEYRKRFITLDYDDNVFTLPFVIDAIDYLKNEMNCKNVKVYKTHRGHHIRAEPLSPLSFDELMKIREKLNDDYNRLVLDELYINKSLSFLANLLFNSKCWIEIPILSEELAAGKQPTLKCYEEKEIDPSTLSIERIAHISINLPKMRIELPKGVVEIDEKRIKFIGRFTERDVKTITTSIEDNFWEYAYVLRKQEDIKKKIKNAYRKISPFLASLINDCEVRLEDGVAVIHVPDNLSKYVGRLIGKQGQNIKAVESELGIKIKISQGQIPEEVAMKKKLRELLKSVIE
ncbi:MAG: KH domain-containing protein [Ignisphaera sp.]